MVKALSLFAPLFCEPLGQGSAGVGGAGKLTQAGVSCRTGLLGRGQRQTDAKYGIQPPQPICSRRRLQALGTLCIIWNSSEVFSLVFELKRLSADERHQKPPGRPGMASGGTIRGSSTSEEQTPRSLSSEPSVWAAADGIGSGPGL